MSTAGSVTRIPDPGRPSTQLRPAALYYPDTTATFHASVFKYNHNEYTQTLVVNCATSCGSDGIPEQTLTVKIDKTLSFAGNHVLSGSRTAWGFGATGGQDTSFSYAATTVKDGEKFDLPVSSTEVPACFVASRLQVVTVTTGLDRIYGWGTYNDNSDFMTTWKERVMSSLSCTASTEHSATQTGGTSASGVVETGSKTTTAGAATATNSEGSSGLLQAPIGLLMLFLTSLIWLTV
ncbi:unnamed protein product [Clonostachys byssicola]|uniref:Uncharacterized protein n=1 Tax=Clonostachys byssicola TaxID=160290 RepID=A0A9N9UD76_9HYPO|nr:unnamed protein product [Clonostachys byssicola]